mgnify:CR=1 FL=1
MQSRALARQAWVVCLVAALLGPGAALAEWTFVELPPLVAPYAVTARAISNTGIIVGDAEVGVDPFAFYPWAHGFAYHVGTGQMVDLGTLPPVGNGPFVLTSQANGVNDWGLVVGEGRFDTEDPTKCRAFICSASGGPMVDLGVLPGGVNSRAMAVNNSGVVVGFSETSTVKRAFRWTEVEGMVPLGDPPNWFASEAYAISDTGIVAGEAVVSMDPPTSHATVWNGDQRIDLGVLSGGLYSYATGVNSAGMVTGESGVTGGVHAFLWTAQDGMMDLGLPEGFTGTVGRGINDSGQVVGWGQGPGITAHALLWADGTWTDLHATYFPDWIFSYASCINDNGWIAGYGLNASYEMRGWVLIPEPATLGLLGLSLLVVRPRKARG